MIQNHTLENADNNQLPLEVLKKFRLIFGTVKQHFREVEQTCGISGSQLWILKLVSKTPNIGVSVLAKQLSIHQSTCSLLVEKLVKRKLINKVRSTEDQRRVGLEVTDEAKTLLNKAPGPAEGALPNALAVLPECILNDLNNSLAKIIEELGNSGEQLAYEPLSDL